MEIVQVDFSVQTDLCRQYEKSFQLFGLSEKWGVACHFPRKFCCCSEKNANVYLIHKRFSRLNFLS